MQYALPATLLKRISSALHLRAQSKLKRKSMEQVQSSAGLSQKPVESVGAVHHSKTTTASADMDIYGDIFEGIGKYNLQKIPACFIIPLKLIDSFAHLCRKI